MKANGIAGFISALIAAATVAGAPPRESPSPNWRVVANSSYIIPGDPDRQYNSFNPPSVNTRGLVVFRARSSGNPQGPVSGIFVRDMRRQTSDVEKLADRDTPVPSPNNTRYPEAERTGETEPASFNEFPAFPRISYSNHSVATRGNHPPVWAYTVPDDGSGLPEEIRAGTSGVYVNLAARRPALSPLVTGASLLAHAGSSAYVDLTYLFRVPGIEPVTRFEVFPGAPAITDRGFIVFKGNYSLTIDGPDGGKTAIPQTGIFWRRVVGDYAGGLEPIVFVAGSATPIPNPGNCPAGTTFGSTAPPSAHSNNVVFAGFDDEGAPNCGGIYLARLTQRTEGLTPMVSIGDPVPGQQQATFSRFGEGLSFDGRFVAFWAAWGSEARVIRVYCPEEGNKVRRAYCNHTGEFGADPETHEPRGDPASICDNTTDPRYPLCYQEKVVPANQGIFVLDSESDDLAPVAMAGPDERFGDFLFWNYSGAPPGIGHSEGDAEPPRFRAAAFLTVSGRTGDTFRAAYLARTGAVDPATHVYVEPVDGVYLVESLGASSLNTLTLLETGMDGTVVDPEAVWDHDDDVSTPDVPLPIVSLGLEREGLRGGWFVVSASMGVEEKGWAGIYAAELPTPQGGE